MDILFHSANIDIRFMNYDDIPFICKADNDESERNIVYLRKQLDNQENIDLIVFEKYRKNGIATALMDVAENIAKKHNDSVYLDVCLNSEYGSAQRLYVKRGYVPDGKGVYYEEKVCATNAICRNDDELTLCLVKKL